MANVVGPSFEAFFPPYWDAAVRTAVVVEAARVDGWVADVVDDRVLPSGPMYGDKATIKAIGRPAKVKLDRSAALEVYVELRRRSCFFS